MKVSHMPAFSLNCQKNMEKQEKNTSNPYQVFNDI